MKPGDLVRVHHSLRAHYAHGRVVEFVAGSYAHVVSEFMASGRIYYNVLYEGQILAVDRLVIEPLDPCDPPVPVV